MGQVTARFKVNRISAMGWATEVEMVPDYAQGRNSEWAEATPAGMMRLTVTADGAKKFFDDIGQHGAIEILIRPQPEE